MAIAEYEERIAIGPLEVVATGGSPTSGLEIGGLAVPYGQVADIHERGNEYREVFMRGAFAGQTTAPQMYFHHAQDQRVGRTPIGVWTEFGDAADGFRVRGRMFSNDLVRPLADAVQAGALRGLSVNFRVPKDGESWSRGNGLPLRTVTKAITREVSLTDIPAYEGAGLGRVDELGRQAIAEMLERDQWMREHGLIEPEMTAQQRDRWMRLRRII
jgi:HK97 family phage prohead protease